jgi:hypothetical protein
MAKKVYLNNQTMHASFNLLKGLPHLRGKVRMGEEE